MDGVLHGGEPILAYGQTTSSGNSTRGDGRCLDFASNASPYAIGWNRYGKQEPLREYDCAAHVEASRVTVIGILTPF